nr:protease modulator HflC [Desulfurispira natronophila]
MAGILAYFSLFIVSFTQSAVVTQLGKPVRTIHEPGLYVRIPFIQEVFYFDRRLLTFDGSTFDMLTRDKKTIVVDNYVQWRITDPLKFMTSVRNEEGARRRIGDLIYAEARREIGSFDFIDVINFHRMEIMRNITQSADEKARPLGIEIVDMRVKRADLPTENERAVFERMSTERAKIATQYRSEGEEAAARIRADSDRQKTIILAEAYREQEELRGEGDAIAAKLYAEALERNPEFYRFMRELDLYRDALKENSTIILNENSDFFRTLMDKR